MPGPYDIIAVGGDSNTYYGLDYYFKNQSATDFTHTYEDAVWDGITYAIQHGGLFVNGVDPMGFGGQPQNPCVSFSLSFCRDYYNPTYLQPGRNSLIIAAGWGGTGFASGEWMPPSGIGYTNFLARIAQGLALGGWGSQNVLKAVLMQIGTNDLSFYTVPAGYLSVLVSFVASLRTDLGLPNLPVVFGGNPPFYTAYTNQFGPQEALPQTPANIANCAYANPYASTDVPVGGGVNIPYGSTWPTTIDVFHNQTSPPQTVSTVGDDGAGKLKITFLNPGTGINQGPWGPAQVPTYTVNSGTPVWIEGLVSTPDINGKWNSITVISATEIVLDSSTSAGFTYTSGGTVNMITGASTFLHFGSDSMRTGPYSFAARYFDAYQSLVEEEPVAADSHRSFTQSYGKMTSARRKIPQT